MPLMYFTLMRLNPLPRHSIPSILIDLIHYPLSILSNCLMMSAKDFTETSSTNRSRLSIHSPLVKSLERRSSNGTVCLLQVAEKIPAKMDHLLTPKNVKKEKKKGTRPMRLSMKSLAIMTLLARLISKN